jgi:hypothetical protein
MNQCESQRSIHFNCYIEPVRARLAPMKNITATIFLTVAMLLGSAGVSVSADFRKSAAAYQNGDSGVSSWELITVRLEEP